ncbi:MAG: tRNA uridine-5-carboxymethylaminomethyl(34) synthesis GTPase MnmE, partial [Clostridia bacterium]
PFYGTVSAENFSDKAFCIYYKAPKSYTGEDIIEIQLHGGLSAVKGVLSRIYSEGVRPAEAGEFTKRAFLNGKLSLSEAEGIADMINAESEASAKQAYRMLGGEFSRGIEECGGLLLTAEATLAAVLDYPDELEEDTKEPLLSLLQEAERRLTNLLKGSEKRRFVTDGAAVAIVGLTNVGKSSLLNALIGEERAIVTDIAGTTRDTLRESIEVDGVRLNFIDTAGIRESGDKVETLGIERARRAMDGADLIIFVADLSEPESDEERELRAEIAAKNKIIVANKGDLARYPRPSDITIEAKNSKNIDALLALISQKLDLQSVTQGAVLTRERHISAVSAALLSVQSAIANYSYTTVDCTLVDIRSGYRALAELFGIDAEESVVDKIFAEFCVGK